MHSQISSLGSRIKLWDIDDGYLCSIIGTCLSLYDLRKLINKLKLGIPKDSPEYSIHGFFVEEAKSLNTISRQLQKMLDRKYKLSLAKFSRATTPEEIEELWQEASDQGDIPGPYWAVLTHVDTNEELRNRVFGEVHMLSHLTGAANRADIRALKQLEEDNRELRDTLDQSRTDFAEKLAECENYNKEIANKNEIINSLSEKLDKCKLALDNRPDLATLEERCLSLEKKLDKADMYNTSLQERLEEVKSQTQLATEKNESLKAKISSLEIEQEALEQDLLSLLERKNMCSCPEKTGNEKGLCGRAILYVGGRSHLVQYYRKLVENRGGIFLYHDGGQQDNPRRLPELIMQADNVCCPIDCISHNATIRIKRECKYTQTEPHLLRSSGLSSFARALSDLSDLDS